MKALVRVVAVLAGLIVLGGILAAVIWLWANISLSHGYLVAAGAVIGLIFVVVLVHWAVTTLSARSVTATSSATDQPPEETPAGTSFDSGPAARRQDGVQWTAIAGDRPPGSEELAPEPRPQ